LGLLKGNTEILKHVDALEHRILELEQSILGTITEAMKTKIAESPAAAPSTTPPAG
jgi:hypothetical protein